MFPLNKNAFCEDEFATSSVTDLLDPNKNYEVFASNVTKAANWQGEEIPNR